MRAAAFLLLGLGACAAAPYAESEDAAGFVEQHYGRIRAGTDWTALQGDFLPDARITRLRPEHPGEMETSTVPEYFAAVAPEIDALQGFSITPRGLRALVYDRVATVWASVEVLHTEACGAETRFSAVDVFILARDAQDRWRIRDLIWQSAVEGWPVPRDRSAQPFTQTGMDARLGFGYSRP